jgi:hypothetical protein
LQSAAEIRNGPNISLADEVPLTRPAQCIRKDKPHPIELRTRVVSYVDEGHGHREAARHFKVNWNSKAFRHLPPNCL